MSTSKIDRKQASEHAVVRTLERASGPLAEKLPTLISIFYGLAIASGLQYASPFVFGSAAYPLTECFHHLSWWLTSWNVSLALYIALADWLAFSFQERKWLSPGSLALDIGSALAIYVLFATSYSLDTFLFGVVAYCALNYILFKYDPTWDNSEAGESVTSIRGRYAAAIGVSAFSIVATMSCSPHTADVLRWVARGGLTAVAFWSAAGRYPELKRHLSKQTPPDSCKTSS